MKDMISNKNNLNDIRFTLSLVSAVINEKKPEEPDFEPDWGFIFQFTKSHHIDNTVFYAIERLKNKPDTQIYKSWMEARNKCVHRTIVQHQEFSLICSAFDKNGIEYMPVKGFAVSEMYPADDVRFMSDLDIMVKDAAKAGTVVTELGYAADRINYMYDDSYIKRPFMHLELHRELFRIYSSFYNYYRDVFERAEKHGTRYNMTREDSYIYVLAHLYKHYHESGTGIRSVCDVYLLNKKLMPELNREYFYGELKKLGIDIFYDEFSVLADKWFKNEDFEDFDDAEEYILDSGTYGKTKNKIVNRQNDLGKKYFYLKRIFPPLSYMKDIFYPVRKCPVLLPIFYIYRIIRLISPKYRKKVEYELKVINNKESVSD